MTIKNNTFEVCAKTVFGRRRSYVPAWRGTVLPSPSNATASRVIVEDGPAQRVIRSWGIFAIWMVLLIGYAVWRGIAGFGGGILMFGVMMLMVVLFSQAGKDLARDESEALLQVVRQIIEAPEPEGSSTTH